MLKLVYWNAENALGAEISRNARYKKNLGDMDSFYNHSINVGRLAYMTSLRMIGKASGIEPEEVYASGVFHDIGKLYAEGGDEDPELLFDGIYGYNYLKREGRNKMADNILPSFTLKELIELKGGSFMGFECTDVIPVTWPQKIVVYSDCMIDGKGNYVKFDKRMEDISDRYEEDSLMMLSLENGGRERLRELCEEIGKLTGI